MAKSPDTFKSFVSRERTRLTRARDSAVNRKNKLDQELSEIETELSAIEAYEQAKKKAPRKPAGRKAAAAALPPRPAGARRAEKSAARSSTSSRNPTGSRAARYFPTSASRATSPPSSRCRTR
jgi:hypothetical protein